MPHLQNAQPAVADLMRRIQKSNLTQTKEIVIPLSLIGGAMQLVVTRGPSLDEETILAWVEPMTTRSDLRTTLVTVQAPLVRCTIERDPFGGDPQVLIGDARFTASDRYAALLETRFGFAVVVADD